jgi:hypothetical protein
MRPGREPLACSKHLPNCRRKEESSFLKKGTKRLLPLRLLVGRGHARLGWGLRQQIKVFWFFSTEKNASYVLVCSTFSMV